MKNKYCKALISTPLVALAMLADVAIAGTTETMAPAPAPAPAEDVVSGVLKLDFNSHFISYGNDVWSDGNPQFGETNFNPMLELAFALPAGFKATVGTWWDVTDKGTSGAIGGNIREVDVWGGLAYTYDKFTVGVVFQDWFYGGTGAPDKSEEILDVNFSYDCFLKPTLTVHNRLGAGASGGDEGTILVAGISHSIEAGPVTFSFPLNVAYFVTDEFHGPTGDSGFGYASIGVGASLALTEVIGESFGNWTLNGGLTYYFTNDQITVNNGEDNFLTASLGLALAF